MPALKHVLSDNDCQSGERLSLRAAGCGSSVVIASLGKGKRMNENKKKKKNFDICDKTAKQHCASA